MAGAGASIVDAKVFTTADGMALDGFWVQDANGGPFDDEQKLARTLSLLEQALAGELALEGALAGQGSARPRRRAAHVISRILVDNRASSQHTVVEINGRDRPGLLYDIGRVLTELGLSIVTAHISTYGAQAVDVFYVKDRYGLQVTKNAEIERVRARLLAALDEPGATAKPAAAE
jgi:[protein-PII] uridylyltransferase